MEEGLPVKTPSLGASVRANWRMFAPLWCLPAVIAFIVAAGTWLSWLRIPLSLFGLGYFAFAFWRALQPYLRRDIGFLQATILMFIVPALLVASTAAIPFLLAAAGFFRR